MLGNFSYCNPTKLYFGKKSLNYLNDELSKYGKNVVLIYGGGSIKKNSIYDAVTKILQDSGNNVAEIAGVKCEELASEMFAAGSNLKNKSPEEIFYQDFKKFELNKSSFGVGQITSVNADELTEIKKELLPYMEKALGSHGESMLFFMLTDIINESTELLFYGGDSKNVVSEAFHKEPQEGEQSVILPGVVSRKKQLIPSFMTAMQQ